MGIPLIWFDRLTTSGLYPPFALGFLIPPFALGFLIPRSP